MGWLQGNLGVLYELSAHEDAHHGSHHQAPCPAAGIAQAIEALYIRCKVRRHLDSVAVELKLRRIKERLIGCKAGNYVIYGLDKVDDVYHGTVRHCCRYVACYRIRQGGTHVRLSQLFLPGSLSAQNVPVALYQNLAVSQHVCKLSHFLCIGNRLIERMGKIVGAENCG